MADGTPAPASTSRPGPWPLTALGVWSLSWALHRALLPSEAPLWLAWLLPAVLGLAAAQWPWVAATRWRSVLVAAGFPLSALCLQLGAGPVALSPWVWLALAAVLLLAYPVRAWRDAPLFPTPAGALQQLPGHAPLRDGARVLDAGCGLGDGLMELRRAYPAAQLEGIEWSRPWAWLCRWRCPWARVTRGDLWAQDWAAFDLVYLFQRPESMPRVRDKAWRELRPGAWLVSLEFEIPGWAPHACLPLTPTRNVWLYRREA